MTVAEHFLDQLKATEQERLVLTRCGAKSVEDVYAIALAFPGLAKAGLRLQVLTSQAMRGMSSSAIRRAEALSVPPSLTFGSVAPKAAPVKDGYTVGALAPTPTRVAGGAVTTLSTGMSWPVRDQWQRGTCVAHAFAACVEHFIHGSTGLITDVSEQFLYAHAKQLDGAAHLEGTWLSAVRAAFLSHGVCLEEELRYNPEPLPTDWGQAASLNRLLGQPGQPVVNSAQTRSQPVMHSGVGNAQAVWNGLQGGRPVAIALPVFYDTANAGMCNWFSPLALAYGQVMDPVTTMVAKGGHAVCVTGYTPDAGAPGGGWFVFRNSWDTAWASAAPAAGYFSPQAGYGTVSADYVDQYLWEMAHL